MYKMFLISVSMFVGAGLAVTTQSILAARQVQDCKVFTGQLGAGAKSTLETWVGNQICPTVNAEFELTGEDVCDPATSFSGMSLRWEVSDEGQDVVVYGARSCVTGTWAK